MPDLGIAISLTDVARLSTTIFIIGAAIQDIRTRRVSNWIWIPPLVIGGATLLTDLIHAVQRGGYAWLQIRQSLVICALITVIAYVGWWLNAIGGADVKAMVIIALTLPIHPLASTPLIPLPAFPSPPGSFALTILTNTAILGLLYPLWLGLNNARQGEWTPAMVVGTRVPVPQLSTSYGRLLTDTSWPPRTGLDLDALRMYLRWRDLDLETLRTDRSTFRDPASLPDSPAAPTDGAVTDGGSYDDPWGAEAFLDDIDGTAYGTTADELRHGLDLITTTDHVWITPGLPFIALLAGGLLLALTYGNILVPILTIIS